MLSVIADPALKYPERDEFFSPDERFPEYRYAQVSSRENGIYRAVRACFAQAGLDREHLDTPSWNPLGAFIRPGSRVFVLCNFVLNRQPGETAQNFGAKCIHGSVLRPLLDYVLLAVGPAGSVAFGNAAMQHCNWQAVLNETGAQAVLEFYRSMGLAVEAKDLRLLVVRRSRLGKVTVLERRQEHNGIPVNLGADSLMVALDREPCTPYRVMNYSPARLEACHSDNNHVYVISRRILEADTILSLSKLKTHEKTGITCALKSLVGTVGHKDSLPHYRFGSPEIGGDECPAGTSGLLRSVLAFHYRAQRASPASAWGTALRVTDRFLRYGTRRWLPVTEGGWCGNDTAWRMVLDLNRIITYATPNGELQSTPCRQHLAFIDGVTGGEGQGPLSPRAVHSGVLLFSPNPVVADFACASLMGFDPWRIPLISEAVHLARYPLTSQIPSDEQTLYNGRSFPASELVRLAPYHYQPPAGWQGKL